MIHSMYTMQPFWSAIIAAVLAQFMKPFIAYVSGHGWHWNMMFAAGGFPSSHSALVTALCVAMGLQEMFHSPIFAVCLAMAVIVIYDAANVRYYSGQNIKVTQQLIKDLQEKYPGEFDSEVYDTKLKDVLGHKWIEVLGGIALGMLVAGLLHWIVIRKMR